MFSLVDATVFGFDWRTYYLKFVMILFFRFCVGLIVWCFLSFIGDLVEYPPLCFLANGFIHACNKIRMIALHSVKEDIIKQTEKCIGQVCNTLISIHIPNFQTSTTINPNDDKHQRSTSLSITTDTSTSSFNAFLSLCQALSTQFITFVTHLLQELYSDNTLKLNINKHMHALSLLYEETEEQLETVQKEEEKSIQVQQQQQVEEQQLPLELVATSIDTSAIVPLTESQEIEHTDSTTSANSQHSSSTADTLHSDLSTFESQASEITSNVSNDSMSNHEAQSSIDDVVAGL